MFYVIQLTNSLTPDQCLWCINYIEEQIGFKLNKSSFTRRWLTGKTNKSDNYKYIGYEIGDPDKKLYGWTEKTLEPLKKIIVNKFLPYNYTISIF